MSLATTSRVCARCRQRWLSGLLARQSASRPPRGASQAVHSFERRSSSISVHREVPRIRSFHSSALCSAVKNGDTAGGGGKKRKVDMEEFPPERIRNLSIIAHIDHGKSTLADRLLQMTGTVPASSSPQFLDKLKVERERGITVKAQTVSIIHTHTDGHRYLINLIDTPGHVDFSYEVSRSLGACEGGLILVDCTQGIQAQTLSVFHVAQEANLTLLPVINKVDLPHASPADTSEQIESTLGLDKSTHMRISAKSGLGVDNVLTQIVEGLPAPRAWEQDDGKLRGLVFDTFYDHFRGVVSLVRLFSGSVKKGDKIKFLQSDRRYEVLEVGIHNPEEVPVDKLYEGQVGYVVCNMKNSEEAFIGDTICLADKMVDPLPGFKPMKAMVYAGVFPIDSGEFGKLEEAIERLTLNDRSVSVQRESSAALSQGFRLGFLGTLHMDVFRQRLEDEYDSNVIVTAPTVPYKVIYHGGKEVFISNPAEFPDVMDPKSRVVSVEEPMVNATIFIPQDYIGEMMDLCSRYRGVQQEYRVLESTDRAILRYSFPLSEIVTDFFSELKSASSGFASFDYEEAGYEKSDLVKLNMMLNGKPVDALAMIVHRSVAQTVGRAWTKKLRDVLPRQLFEVAIQAAIGTRVLARETLSAMRKDVTAGLYGGHYERKMKHLNKQKEGKKRLKRLAGNIDIPQSAFFDVLSSRPRGFCTSARRPGEPHVTDFQPSRIVESLPSDLAMSALFEPNAQSTAPPSHIPRHTIPPAERSAQLSHFHRLVSSPDSTTEDIHSAFIQLYLASPYSHVFTPVELQTALRAMLRHETGNVPGKRLNLNTKIRPVLDEMKDISGKENATKRLDLAFTTAFDGSIRRVTQHDLHEAITAFLAVFPRAPKGATSRAKTQYYQGIGNLLQLAAKVGDVKRFDTWRERLRVAGNEVDANGHARLAHLVLLNRTGRHDEISVAVNEALVSEQPISDRMILLNYAIWSHAIRGDWAAIAPLLAVLVPSIAPMLPSSGNKDRPIILPEGQETHFWANRETFSIIINALSHQGHLQPALQVIQVMLQEDLQPGISDFMQLFKGFARHGVVPPQSRAGVMANAFPMWSRFEPPQPGRKDESNAANTESGSFARLWGKTGFGLSRDKGNSVNADGHQMEAEAEWTFDNLQEVFRMFLQLSPTSPIPTGPNLGSIMNPNSTAKPKVAKGDAWAPKPKAIWTILMAFARTTNGDREVLGAIWADLERKFGPGHGPGVDHRVSDVSYGMLGEDGMERGEVEEEEEVYGNAEGWKGWREDGRLSKLREKMEQIEEAELE